MCLCLQTVKRQARHSSHDFVWRRVFAWYISKSQVQMARHPNLFLYATQLHRNIAVGKVDLVYSLFLWRYKKFKKQHLILVIFKIPQ